MFDYAKKLRLRLCLGGMALAMVWSGSRAVEAAVSAMPDAAPNMAFYYDGDLPVDELQAFDVVVIDPQKSAIPAQDLAPRTAWFARLDLRGLATDPSQPDAQWLLQQLQPLWQKGYRGFLLDDGAALSAASDAADVRLEQLIDAIRQNYPAARLVLKNHLALAERLSGKLQALVVDGLYRPSDAGSQSLSAADPMRGDLLARIDSLQRRSGLRIVAIDYCRAADKACRRETAARIRRDGLMPYVTDPAFSVVGIGRLEVMPRKVLIVHSPGEGEPLDRVAAVRDVSMPLNYLGYDIQYADVNQPLPVRIGSDRYAGIVVRIDNVVKKPDAWRRWLLARMAEGMPVAVLGQFGFAIDHRSAQKLGLALVAMPRPPDVQPRIVAKAAMLGFEIMPPADIRNVPNIRALAEGQSLLRLAAGDYTVDAAAILPWGGYTLDPYGLASLPDNQQMRWVIQPIEFLTRALSLPAMPVPDVTTENGRRLMFVHVDGDGFASRAEFPGPDYGAQALYDQVFKKFAVPTTLSVIEGEVGKAGLYPNISPRLEQIARQMFALPNVEIGTHTFSHPFMMEMIDERGKRIRGKGKASDGDFSLNIPGYEFDLNREIQGSIDYINGNLAPSGKRVAVVQWPGNAAASPFALRFAHQAGVLSINGGDTNITRSNKSWSNIAPYGVAKGNGPDEFQVYAATMDENVYTNDWRGPFYGFNRVLETFSLTDSPLRFKAINIYYHMYSGTKLASLKALINVYEGALKQAVFPIYTTDYIRRVLDWRRVAVARDGDGWLVRSGSNLRQLRWPGKGVPDVQAASGVSGYAPGPGGLYVHMASDEARFVLNGAGRAPYISAAAGFVRGFQRDAHGIQFEFGGYYKPDVVLANASGCRVSVDGQPVRARLDKNGQLRFSVTASPARSVSYHAIRVAHE